MIYVFLVFSAPTRYHLNSAQILCESTIGVVFRHRRRRMLACAQYYSKCKFMKPIENLLRANNQYTIYIRKIYATHIMRCGLSKCWNMTALRGGGISKARWAHNFVCQFVSRKRMIFYTNANEYILVCRGRLYIRTCFSIYRRRVDVVVALYTLLYI